MAAPGPVNEADWRGGDYAAAASGNNAGGAGASLRAAMPQSIGDVGDRARSAGAFLKHQFK